MTRLSEALKRAAETAATPAPATEAAAPAAMWQFAPVETMYVPEATAPAAEEPRPAPPPPVARPRVSQGLPEIRVGDADRDKLVIGGYADATVVEQYRHLAAVLHHAQEATGVCSVMVTSAMPSEGKTLTATNLALTLSESYQRRVLLIDGDLRRPRLREMFALPVTEGLTDSLTTVRGDRLPVHQITPTLWVLTAGRMLPDPMSLLSSPAMNQLINDAKESFDWVVVDTPPIAILPDANLLSSMIDTALLVVSAESTPYPMVQRAADAIGQKRILGVVLNRAEKATLPSSSDYYRYNYSQPGHPMPAARKRWFGWLRKSGGVPHVQ